MKQNISKVIKQKHIILLKMTALLLAVLVAGFCYSCDHGTVLTSLEPITEVQAAQPESISPEVAEIPSPQPEETRLRYYVHICGEVMHPGVYEMAAGDRIYQVVEQAGGYTEAAAMDYLNLAEPVWDGMKLVVPNRSRLAEAADQYGLAEQSREPGTVGAAAAGKINLNTATKEQLMTLRGIGEARAGDILRYREEHGGFSCIEDIMKISGIKDAAFQKIKDSITV